MSDDMFEEYKRRIAASTQHCPICNDKVLESPRSPRYLCNDCVERAVDVNGRAVGFYDRDSGAGLKLRFKDKTPPDRASPDVEINTPSATGYPHIWVEGVECEARVADFDGVVVQTADWRDFMQKTK